MPHISGLLQSKVLFDVLNGKLSAATRGVLHILVCRHNEYKLQNETPHSERNVSPACLAKTSAGAQVALQRSPILREREKRISQLLGHQLRL